MFPPAAAGGAYINPGVGGGGRDAMDAVGDALGRLSLTERDSGPPRVAELKRHLERRRCDHVGGILKEASLKDAHVYCVVNGLSAQQYGPLLERYIIDRYGFEKNHASRCKGDCYKAGVDYEIKASLGGATHARYNYVQIRIAHGVAYYLLTAFHLIDDNVDEEGELYVFKLSKSDMVQLVLAHGSYAHGTTREHARITKASLEDPDSTKEYAVRTTYGGACWKRLLRFRIAEAEL
jgi:hypothetical protein